MRHFFKIFTLLAFTALMHSSCNTNDRDDDLIKLKTWMTGSFNSEEQSKQDSNFYNINFVNL